MGVGGKQGSPTLCLGHPNVSRAMGLGRSDLEADHERKGTFPRGSAEEAAPLGGHETSSASDDSVRELP